VRISELPPLRVHASIESHDGFVTRWALDEPDGGNVINALRCSDTMPGGYETCDGELPRPTEFEYRDTERLSTLRLLGVGSTPVWEGRLERIPRVSGDRMAISPSTVGWQAALEDNKSAVLIVIDRTLSAWRGPGAARQLALAVADNSQGETGTASEGALTLTLRGPWGGSTSGITAETYYEAPAGETVAEVAFAWATNDNVGADATFLLRALSTDDESSFPENSADVLTGSTSGTLTFNPSTPLRMGMIQFRYPTAAGGDGVDYAVSLTNVRVQGSHGLTEYGTTAGEEGFLASDIVRYAVRRWAPHLNVTADSVTTSAFVIQQLAFLEPTTAAEIVQGATRFGLEDWAVWDDKTFYWHPRGARGRNWRARIGPSDLEETGPQVDRLWESIIVQYQDVDGSTRTVGPPGSGADTEDAALKDDDPDNPANQFGISRRDRLVMGVGTAAGAIEVGRRFLAETKQLDRSGKARIQGHILDDHGVIYPYHAVKSGDTISFVDANDTSPRRIVRTEKNTADRSCSLDLDAPPEGMQALLERLGAVLAPLGL
jgi:hypothetical protein